MANKAAATLEDVIESVRTHTDAIKTYRAETGADYAKVDGKVVELTKLIETQDEKIKGLEAQLKARPENLMPGVGDEIKKNGPVNPFEVFANPDSRDFSLVREYNKKTHIEEERTRRGTERKLAALGGKVRDMTASDDASGGYLIAAALLPGYVEKARAHSVVFANAGCTIYENLVGAPVILPFETGDPVIQEVGENSAPTEQDDTVGQVQFQPHRLATLTKFSNRLLRNSALAEEVVRKAITIRFGSRLDYNILLGTGANYQVLGVANQAGVNLIAIGSNGGYATFQVALSMEIAIEMANLGFGVQKFVGNPRFFWSMKQERIATYSGDTQGFYVILPMSDANLKDSLGYDFLKTTIIPTTFSKGAGTNLTAGFFGDWSEVHIALWENLFFKMSDVAGDSTGSAFTQSQMWLLAEMEWDMQVPRPQAFSIVTDCLTS